MVRSKHAKKSGQKRNLSAPAATVLIILIGIIIFLYRDRLSSSVIGAFSNGEPKTVSGSEPFTYETGSKQIFSPMGDSLAIASTTGLQLLDSSGETVSREVFSMVNPAVCSNETCCAFFDVGGKTLRIFKDGKIHDLDRTSAIISVTVNSNGYFAVAEEETGYKGSVTVYGSDLEPKYKWYSGSGYTLDAAVSPDNGTLAVLCVGPSGSIIHLMHLDSEEEFASISIPDELAFKIHFAKNGNLYALSEKSIRFYGSGGKELSIYNFKENYLANYEFSDEFCAVVLSKYVSGSDVSLLSFGADGKVLGTILLDGEPLSLSSHKQKLLVLDAESVALYSDDLRLQKKNHVVPGSMSAVLMPKSSILLLSSHYGQKCEFT